MPRSGIASPILNLIPVQILSYYLAIARGFDPDKPKEFGKIGDSKIRRKRSCTTFFIHPWILFRGWAFVESEGSLERTLYSLVFLLFLSVFKRNKKIMSTKKFWHTYFWEKNMSPLFYYYYERNKRRSHSFKGFPSHEKMGISKKKLGEILKSRGDHVNVRINRQIAFWVGRRRKLPFKKSIKLLSFFKNQFSWFLSPDQNFSENIFCWRVHRKMFWLISRNFSDTLVSRFIYRCSNGANPLWIFSSILFKIIILEKHYRGAW